MWIAKIELFNFKSYQHQAFEFPQPRAGRNIVLIGGMNGYGKTSVLEALYLGLYGKEAVEHLGRAGLKDDVGYLRQVDLPGIHTKFIESQRGVLAELLDLALPAAAVDPARGGAQQFAARYGFLDKPALLRFRVLDAALSLLPGTSCPDLALDADSFARLQLDVARVFITENETNFLAFPRVMGAIVIFGAGYGWEALARAEWLQRCPIHYWGDIDTNGFAILAQLRARFAHVESLLMDRTTLHAHEPLWGREDSPRPAEVSRLTADECSLYEDLRDHRIRPCLRLEQEHIGFGWLEKALKIIHGVDDFQPLSG